MSRVLLTLTVLLTCGYVAVSLTQDDRRGDAIVFPGGGGSVQLGARTSATRDADAIYFPDTDDDSPAGGDSSVSQFDVENNPAGGDSVTEAVESFVSNSSEAVVTEAVESFVSNSSQAVVTEAVESFVSNSSQAVVTEAVESFVSNSSQAVVTEAVESFVSNSSQAVTNQPGANSSASDRPDSVAVAVNEVNTSVEYKEDADDVIPDEYRVEGHNDSFSERNGLVSRAAIVAPKRRSNKGRMVNGVLRVPV